MDKLQRKLWFLTAVVFATCITVFTLSYMVTIPWRMLPDLGGDGIKNAFTYLYHSMYGHGYWFGGMNYPYGEHIVYTDGQPLLSVLLTHFHNVTSGQALTVFWWLTGLSYILAIIFVYRILLRFKVSQAASIIFAGLIVLGDPQIFCLHGHYALGYMCVMPMLFYWSLLYHEEGQRRYCVYIFVIGIITAFLHPYFMAMILVWVMSYTLGYFIFIKQKFTDKLKHVLPVVISAVLVFLVVAIIMKVTDPFTDRPETPFREGDMYTTLPQIFTSEFSPAWKHAINQKLVKKVSNGGEGFSYIGFVCAVAVFMSMLIFAVNKMRKKQTENTVFQIFSPIWLFIAFAVLLLSMGIPFIWHMEWLLDYLSVLKQFRTLGRFIWIFYYVITIYGVVVIGSFVNTLIRKRKLFYAYLILILSMSIWAYEASGNVEFARKLSREGAYNYDLVYSKFEQNWDSFLREKHYQPQDFQAVLLLPFFHIGTEKIWVGDPGWLITMGVRPALQLHLPIVDVMMSRSSWSVAQKQVKIAGGPFTDKAILRDIKSNKPFLLFSLDNAVLDADQHYLLDASDFIGDFYGGKVYAFYPERLVANDKKCADSVNNILPYMRSADTCVNANGAWYINHFENGKAGTQLFGTGASLPVKSDEVIANIPVKPVKDSEVYEFSCWFLLSKDDYKSPDIHLDLIGDGGKKINSIIIPTAQSVDSRNLWFRSSKFFYMPAGCRNIICTIEDLHTHSYKIMDEMQLRLATALIISKADDGTIMVNNHLFGKKQ